MDDSKNILIIGNGFDLHCGLPTRYSDFLFFINCWEKFYKKYKEIYLLSDATNDTTIHVTLGKHNELIETSIEDFAKSAHSFNQEMITYINDNIKNNVWIKYIQQLHINNEGWVDFEKDIEDALRKIELYYTYSDKEWRQYVTPDIISRSGQYQKIVEIVQLLGNNKYELKMHLDYDTLYNEKKQLLSELKNQMDIFENILHIYLKEFVGKLKIYNNPPLKFDNKSLYILSFNYTDTAQKIYQLADNRCHYVHGKLENEYYEIKNEKKTLTNNLVLGIDDNAFDNTDYIYFQKFFQRIQKRTGSVYRHWIPMNAELFPYLIIVHIYGHSLDKTDKTIFEYWFNSNYTIKIYVRDQEDYEKKIINLTDMMGKEYVIENTGKDRIQFIMINDNK